MSGCSRFAPRFARGALAIGGALAIAAPVALAATFETENVKGSFDSTVSLGFQWRMADTDCRFVGNDNGGCAPTTGKLGELVNGPGMGATSNPDFNYLQSDNGNLNYRKNSLISQALKGNHELSLHFRDGWSALGRFSWLWDPAVDRTDRTPLASDAKRVAAQDVTLLDLWVAKDFEVGDMPGKVKVGNQVLSWGEDIFIYGGINIINPFDLTRAHKAGVQIKEIVRPVPMVSFNLGVNKNWSVEGFWQFHDVSFRFDPVGTPFSIGDVIGNGQMSAFIPSSVLGEPPGTVGDPGTVSNGAIIPAGQRFSLDDLISIGTVVPTQPTQSAPNANQFGLAARWKPENFNAEFGFYYIHYNDKIPFVAFVNDPSISSNPFGLGYKLQYGKNRDLFGVSVNGNLGDWAVGAEVSYRPRDGVAIDPTVPLEGPMCAFCAPGTYDGYADFKKWQAHATAIYLLGPSGDLGWLLRGLGAAEGTLLFEAAVTYYPNLDLSGRYPILLPNYELPDKTSTGLVTSFNVVYPHVFGTPVNLTPQIDVLYDMKGTSPNTLPFVEGRLTVTPSLNFEYLNKWRASISYTSFSGGSTNNLMADRDYLAVMFSYAF
ncbi:MAG: DUF1302 domain-containing protein [Burkholderiales bacterium]|jgi:hypothetical protein|nr:DUF1302 domain-containing protein [Burkholderiales bacterium]